MNKPLKLANISLPNQGYHTFTKPTLR